MSPEEIEQRAQRRAQFILDSRKITQRSQEIMSQLETETPTRDYPPVRMPGYENALRLTQLLSGDEPLIGSEVDIEMERLVATRRYQLAELPAGHSEVLPNRGRNVLNSLSQLPRLRVGSAFLQSRSLIESSTRIIEGVFQLVLFELCKRAIHKFSSSVDGTNSLSESTGEETHQPQAKTQSPTTDRSAA